MTAARSAWTRCWSRPPRWRCSPARCSRCGCCRRSPGSPSGARRGAGAAARAGRGHGHVRGRPGRLLGALAGRPGGLRGRHRRTAPLQPHSATRAGRRVRVGAGGGRRGARRPGAVRALRRARRLAAHPRRAARQGLAADARRPGRPGRAGRVGHRRAARGRRTPGDRAARHARRTAPDGPARRARRAGRHLAQQGLGSRHRDHRGPLRRAVPAADRPTPRRRQAPHPGGRDRADRGRAGRQTRRAAAADLDQAGPAPVGTRGAARLRGERPAGGRR